jgi:hypothetical protein
MGKLRHGFNGDFYGLKDRHQGIAARA